MVAPVDGGHAGAGQHALAELLVLALGVEQQVLLDEVLHLVAQPVAALAQPVRARAVRRGGDLAFQRAEAHAFQDPPGDRG